MYLFFFGGGDVGKLILLSISINRKMFRIIEIKYFQSPILVFNIIEMSKGQVKVIFHNFRSSEMFSFDRKFQGKASREIKS